MDEDYPVDSIARALSAWSGLPPEAHEGDAWGIVLADLFQMKTLGTAKDRADRIKSAAQEIEWALASMSWQEQLALQRGFESSKDKPIKLASPVRIISSDGGILPGNEPLTPIFGFLRSLMTGAQKVLDDVESAGEAAPAVSENADRRNRIVAIHVGEIYTRHGKKEPPAAGIDGPFQRLLRSVYICLGRHGVDLRGPLSAVHEFRKNRKS